MNDARKEVWKSVYKKYKQEKCNEKGEVKEKNFKRNEREGVKKLLKRKKDGEIVVAVSDKGKQLTVSTIDSYRRQGMKEIKGDTEITKDEVKKDTREVDELGRQYAEIFQVGSARGPQNNAKAYSNLGNKSGDVPEKDTMPKTHKTADKDGDPKARG